MVKVSENVIMKGNGIRMVNEEKLRIMVNLAAAAHGAEGSRLLQNRLYTFSFTGDSLELFCCICAGVVFDCIVPF